MLHRMTMDALNKIGIVHAEQLEKILTDTVLLSWYQRSKNVKGAYGLLSYWAI